MDTDGDGVWIVDNGKFTGEIVIHPERLSVPLKRRKDTVFSIWNDWAHEAVPVGFQGHMVLNARLSKQHTFLALTKRPQNAMNFFKWYGNEPPENWWNGLTVCNQQEADEKIPVFLQVPGKKFLSLEPLLGPVDFSTIRHGSDPDLSVALGGPWGVDAVILGGETGPGARPMHPDWVRSVRDQCAAAGVDFFFKGWGEWCHYTQYSFGVGAPCLSSVRAENELYRVGRKMSGRLLDGRTHDELAWRN
jgi:protein gp37